jgi:predicted nucleic acid-binding protein
MRVFFDANICLDLLDTARPTSAASVAWYMEHKDDMQLHFAFSGDFITTIYYILTARKRIDGQTVVKAIDALSMEITPLYIEHLDFVAAKQSFTEGICRDFEDAVILHSALRAGSDLFLTNDAALVAMKQFGTIRIASTK